MGDWDENGAMIRFICSAGTSYTNNVGYFSDSCRKNADVTLYFNKILLFLCFLCSKMIIQGMKVEPLVFEDMTSDLICTADPYIQLEVQS